MDTIHSLDQFNCIFRDYIRNYNLTFHTGIRCTPFDRYRKTADQAKPVQSREWLDECFLNRVYRKVYRQNFYLWMFISQEGLWSEAKEFVDENMETPMPFESEIKTKYVHKT